MASTETKEELKNIANDNRDWRTNRCNKAQLREGEKERQMTTKSRIETHVNVGASNNIDDDDDDDDDCLRSTDEDAFVS